jgi:ribosomal-protein-alanine N-acetyltransferase
VYWCATQGRKIGRTLTPTSDIRSSIERGEEWHWTLRLKETPDQHIGVISLHRDEWDNRGYWLGLPWHRQGLMTEAVIAVNDYWFDVLGFPVLRAPKAVANIASRRISEKNGDATCCHPRARLCFG